MAVNVSVGKSRPCRHDSNQLKLTVQIVQWMCFTFNDSESSRFKDDFYCIPPGILKTVLQKRNLDSFREVLTFYYVGLGPHFDADTRYFEKVLCVKNLQLSVFSDEIVDVSSSLSNALPYYTKNCMVSCVKNLRLSVFSDEIVDISSSLSNALPYYTKNCMVLASYSSCDCGVYVIKFMQYWSLDKPLQFWKNDVLQEFQKKIILKIVMGPHNLLIGQALEAMDKHHVRRN
ncbi:hypothetical protein AHAS_Ahas20G0038400 [Arachis hypogaea]